MTSSESISPQGDAEVAALERNEFKTFLRISTKFLAGLAIALLIVEHGVGIWLAKSGHLGGISPEVRRAADRISAQPGSPHAIILGDSVARQLFPHNQESSNRIVYLPTNAAVTMAGQYYLAQDAMNRWSSLTDIYLVLLPITWQNNMPRTPTHDYFCAHFHSPERVLEILLFKRDIELSLAHLGRCFLPNLLAANSLSQPATAMQPSPDNPLRPSDTSEAPDPERWLTLLSSSMAPKWEEIPPAAPGTAIVRMSPVSQHFLAKLKADCRQRGIRLHVLPCPVSSEKCGITFVDPMHVYDAPIIDDIPAADLVDGIHMKPERVAEIRRRFMHAYGPIPVE